MEECSPDASNNRATYATAQFGEGQRAQAVSLDHGGPDVFLVGGGHLDPQASLLHQRLRQLLGTTRIWASRSCSSSSTTTTSNPDGTNSASTWLAS